MVILLWLDILDLLALAAYFRFLQIHKDKIAFEGDTPVTKWNGGIKIHLTSTDLTCFKTIAKEKLARFNPRSAVGGMGGTVLVLGGAGAVISVILGAAGLTICGIGASGIIVLMLVLSLKETCLSHPDYVVHPQNWTKYGLNEDSASDSVCGMSEKQFNTFAALQFLEDLRARKRGGQEKNEECKDEGESSSSAVVFCKPMEPTELQAMEGGKETVKAWIIHESCLNTKLVRGLLGRERQL